jgi:[ribosomal protein S5]-alanine N-acetyltransferase
MKAIHESIPSHTMATERLWLKALGAPEWHQLVSTRTDGEIMEFMGCDTAEELAMERLRYRDHHSGVNRSFLSFLLLERETGRVLGKCGFHNWMPNHNRSEMGYRLFHDADKGRGYMKEALRPIVAYGFADMGLHRIEAFTGKHNEASQRLLKGLGFRFEGILREHFCVNGVNEDSWCFSLLKREFGQGNV